MYPEKIKYFYKLIENCKKVNRWIIVEETCEKLKKVDINNPLLFYELAIAQRALGKLEESFLNVNKSIESNLLNYNQLAYVHYLKALILIDIKAYDDARTILNTIKINYPKFKEVEKLIQKLQLP